MEVVIVEDPQQVGVIGADVISQHVQANPHSVIGLATGSSPIPVYREIAARVASGSLSLAQCQAVMLDEYVGLPAGHPQSYRQFLQDEFLDHIDIDQRCILTLEGNGDDLGATCEAFEAAIVAAGGVDVQLLGIGSDGHIAFNEPGSSLSSRTRPKTLTMQTRRDNARFFDGDVSAVPNYCLTQGIGTILDARHILLVATGHGKAEAVHQLVEGPVSALWPASVLQMHRHVTVVLDEAAAARLQLKDYYREAFAGKPSWQAY